MKKDNLYIAQTYFHLIISTIKGLKRRGKDSIIITTHLDERTLFDDKKIIENLKKSGIFKKIILIDDSEINNKVKKNLPLYYLYLRGKAKKYRKLLKDYDEINVFNDGTLIGKTLTISGIKYNLIEDGIDSMKNPQYIPKNTIKKRIMKKLKIYQLAQSPNIRHYEVNNASIVPDIFDRNKIVEVPKKKLLNNLNEKNKRELLDIFGVEKGITNNQYGILILTQPFDTGYPFISEEKKIEIYHKIIDKHSDKRILIKTHPREKTDYSKYFPNCRIISEKFPIELINFLPIKFNEVITVSSTAAIYNTKKTTILGWDWLDKETGGAIYGKK